MKILFASTCILGLSMLSLNLAAQTGNSKTSLTVIPSKHLFIDVHQLEPGKVTYQAVAGAHAKDLAIEKQYGVQFLKYWVDEKKGLVYCLSSASDSSGIRKTHAAAHGLLPAYIYQVTEGAEATLKNGKSFFLDIHQLGAGKVTAAAVAAAHQKDLVLQGKYNVNFINYWLDEKKGTVICLSQADDASSIIKTHKEAHGLLPAEILKVQQGQ